MSWNYYEHGVTQSFIRLYRQCRYQTYLKYVKGISSKKTSEALSYGSYCHYVLEQVLKNQFHNDDYSAPTLKDIGKYIEEYANKVGDDTETDEFNERYHSICGLLKAYFEIYKFDSSKYNILAVEYPFKIEYMDTYLNGKIDVILEDCNGNIWITDHKFLWSRTDLLEVNELLPFDIQCNFYTFAGRNIFGNKVRGMIYDVVKKTSLRRKVSESALEFGARIYDEAKINFIKQMMRMQSTVLDEETESWEKYTLQPTVKEIKVWFDNGFIPRTLNDDALVNKYGHSEFYEWIVNQNFHFYREDEDKHPFGEI